MSVAWIARGPDNNQYIWRTSAGHEPSISVIICTRNRARLLTSCLEALRIAILRASCDHISAEAVLVDNGSNDQTYRHVTDWAIQQSFPITIVREPRPGLARARNAGLSAANGKIMAFTDDDCELDEAYASTVHAAFEYDAEPTIRGGRIELGDPGDLPITIKTSLKHEALRSHQYPGGFIHGANLCFDRRVFAKVGGFDPRFGAGARYIAGEDTDFIIRAQRLGVPILYDPNIVVAHFHGRRSSIASRRLHAGYFYSDGALVAKHFLTTRSVGRFFMYSALQGAFDLTRPKKPADPLGRWRSFRAAHQLRGFIAFLQHQALSPSIEHEVRKTSREELHPN